MIALIHMLFYIFLGVMIGAFVRGNNTLGVIFLILMFVDIGIGVGLTHRRNNTKNDEDAIVKAMLADFLEENKDLISHSASRTTTPAQTKVSSYLPNGTYFMYDIGDFSERYPEYSDSTVEIGKSTKTYYDIMTDTFFISGADNLSSKAFTKALDNCTMQTFIFEDEEDEYDLDNIYEKACKSDPSIADGTHKFILPSERHAINNDDDCAEDDCNDVIYNMLGEPVNELTFRKGQSFCPGFALDMNNTIARYNTLSLKKFSGDALSVEEETQLIFPLIFGNYHVKIDLDEALRRSKTLYERTVSRKPSISKDADNLQNDSEYVTWLNEYAMAAILLGTVYAYKHEYVAASYYFMKGLKTDNIILNMHYCDFIRYVLCKLDKMHIPNDDRTGCGFCADDPIGSVNGGMLNASTSMKLISDMEGEKGEVIAAHMGRAYTYGHLIRKGSCSSCAVRDMVDAYETYIIDSKFNIKKTAFYVNGYFRLFTSIKVADGFVLKDNSRLKSDFTVIE